MRSRIRAQKQQVKVLSLDLSPGLQRVMFTAAFHLPTRHWLGIASNGNIQTILSAIRYIFYQNLFAPPPSISQLLKGSLLRPLRRFAVPLKASQPEFGE